MVVNLVKFELWLFFLTLLGVFLGVVKWTQFTNFITIITRQVRVDCNAWCHPFITVSGGKFGMVTITTCLAVNGGGW